MVLGDSAREQGAYCDRIPASLPGVGYVRVDGVREPARVRAGHVKDEDIAAMVRDYAPHHGLDGEHLFQAAEQDIDAEIIELPTAHADERPEANGEREAS